MKGAPERFLVVAAWYAILGIIAITAVGVELDRQGRFDPVVATIVPGPFRSDALENLTRRAFERNDGFRGEAFARELVARRPVPAEVLALYANGLLVNHKEEDAIAVLQVAASRGWRDRFVQRIVISSALEQGAPKVAANRVVGLWRLGERSDWLKGLTEATLRQSPGLLAFESTLTKGDWYFATDLLSWAASSLPTSSVDHLARSMAARDINFDCKNFSGSADRLVRSGRYLAAITLWSIFCEPGSAEKINVLDFVNPHAASGPFDWRYPDVAGVDIDFQQNQNDIVLRYSSSEPVLQVIARRYIVLTPGGHLLKTGTANLSSGVKWHIACVGARVRNLELRLNATRDGEWSFIIPSDCQVQELTISVRSGSGEVARAGVS